MQPSVLLALLPHTCAGLPGWARAVVFDEADLLLAGGYGAQMRILWDALRGGDRLHAARRVCAQARARLRAGAGACGGGRCCRPDGTVVLLFMQLRPGNRRPPPPLVVACSNIHHVTILKLQAGLSEDEFGELPYHLRRAALKDGLQGLLDAGFRPRQPLPPAAAAAPDGAGAHALQPGPEGERAPGVHGPSWRRQYIFVAATMPAEGERSVGAEIAARFPDATWLAGKQLHQSKRAVQHSWRALADEAERAAALQVGCGCGCDRGWVLSWSCAFPGFCKLAAWGAGAQASCPTPHSLTRCPARLQEVLASDEQLQAGGGRMLVFARDVAAAEATAAALGGAGLPQAVLQYHKRVPAEERAAALQRMATEEGLVMVCTDAAARGLDVPEVTHVVQASLQAVVCSGVRAGAQGHCKRGPVQPRQAAVAAV